MARRGNDGGGWNFLTDVIVTLICASIALVVLVSSGGWNILSDVSGVGSHVSTSQLVDGSGHASSLPDSSQGRSLWDLLGLSSSSSSTSKADESSGSKPKADASTESKKDAASNPMVWQAGLDATNTIGTAKARPGGYDRAKYFGGWASNGCGSATTRDTILARDMSDVVKDSQCRVTSGVLHDPYTGGTIRFRRGANTSSAVQVDHVVALLDAWESGARDWPQSKRVEYANSPGVLLASDGPANMEKGAGLDVNGTGMYRSQSSGAPDIWMPDDKSYRCDYMAKRASIKSKWGLTMTPREKQQTVNVLSQCVAGTYGK
mgnify:CR=1 FL=1|jgi:hypothetical protein